jgi:hypothetical protein
MLSDTDRLFHWDGLGPQYIAAYLPTEGEVGVIVNDTCIPTEMQIDYV